MDVVSKKSDDEVAAEKALEDCVREVYDGLVMLPQFFGDYRFTNILTGHVVCPSDNGILISFFQMPCSCHEDHTYMLDTIVELKRFLALMRMQAKMYEETIVEVN